MSKIEQNLIEPLIRYTFHRLYPYLMITSVIFILTFLLALLILLLFVKQIKNGKVRVASKKRNQMLKYFYFIQGERKDVEKLEVEV